eukprot:scaffold6871_cov75-Phaeocystis_antarctica.AAC.6
MRAAPLSDHLAPVARLVVSASVAKAHSQCALRVAVHARAVGDHEEDPEHRRRTIVCEDEGAVMVAISIRPGSLSRPPPTLPRRVAAASARHRRQRQRCRARRAPPQRSRARTARARRWRHC